MKENPDKSVEELEEEAINISAKKAAKEVARAARMGPVPVSSGLSSCF